jgi:hypothetical protein
MAPPKEEEESKVPLPAPKPVRRRAAVELQAAIFKKEEEEDEKDEEEEDKEEVEEDEDQDEELPSSIVQRAITLLREKAKEKGKAKEEPPKPTRVTGYAMLVTLAMVAGFNFSDPEHQKVGQMKRGEKARVAAATGWRTWLQCVFSALYPDLPVPTTIRFKNADGEWDAANLTMAFQLTAFVCGWTRERTRLLQVVLQQVVKVEAGQVNWVTEPRLYLAGQALEEEPKVIKCRMHPAERRALDKREKEMHARHKTEDDADRARERQEEVERESEKRQEEVESESEKRQDDSDPIKCSTMEPSQREHLRYG